jgi:adenylosuccinate synthase
MSGLPRHCVVVDLGYGDAGKGTVVDWLCCSGGAQPFGPVPFGPVPFRNVVRFNTPGVRTHLSRFMLVDPLALSAEADDLAAQEALTRSLLRARPRAR